MAAVTDKVNRNNKSLVIARQFSPPPMCAITPEIIPKNGEPIIVINRDGSRIKGKLHDNGLLSNELYIITEQNIPPNPVNVGITKIINLPNTRKWIDIASKENSALPVMEKPPSVDFKVDFRDGDELKGKTMGFNADKLGLYLFPTSKEGFFFYTFIPHEVIANYQIGPKIGKQLIEDRYISPEQIESALEKQNDIRKLPLGEYLTNNALVTTKELEDALSNQKSMPNLKLGEILLQENLITEEQLEEALRVQKQDRSIPLGEILIKQGKLTLEQVQHSLARKLGVPFVDLDKISIDEAGLKLVPKSYAKEHKVLPIHVYENKLVLVMNNPLDWKILEETRFMTKLQVIPVMAMEDKLMKSIETGYYALEEIIEDNESDVLFEEEEFFNDSTVADNKVVRLANKIIIDAYQRGVSDIHIEPNPGKEKTTIRFRKDGSLINYQKIPASIRRALVTRYKVMAGMDVSERRIPQDGKINFGRFAGMKLELRLATIPTAGAEEDVVIRILAGGEPVSIDRLLLSKDNLQCTKYVLKNPHGLFLVCGPTGSGKTTTLHSLLSHLNTLDRKIWTVEDPVEITQKGVRQVQVQPKSGLTFASAMRAFLRADPDIIMVGEMRDHETTEIAIEASLTGHLVLSTMHTNSAVESVIRLLEMGMDPYNFSDALLGILAQRLTGKLCPDCKEAYAVDVKELESLANEFCHDYENVRLNTGKNRPEAIIRIWQDSYANDNGEIILYKNKDGGCQICEGTGFKGRIGLHEMLMASNEVRVAIYRQLQANELLKIALDEGMKTLKQDGIEKVLQGLTTMHQVRKVSGR